MSERYAAAVAHHPREPVVALAHGGAVELYDVGDPAHPTLLDQTLFGPSVDVRAVAFSPDGRFLAATAGWGAWIWGAWIWGAWIWGATDPRRIVTV